MNTFSERLKSALNEADMRAADLARRINVTPAAISLWMKNGSIAGDNLIKVARALSVRPEWLQEGVGPMQGAIAHLFKVSEPQAEYSVASGRIPVVGTAQLGEEGYHFEFEYPVGFGDGYIDFPSKHKQAYALRCKGDSMRPRIKPGEFVVVEPREPIAGEEVLVRLKDGRVMVKVLDWNRGGIIQLSSINENFRPMSFDLSEVDRLHYVVGVFKADLYFPD